MYELMAAELNALGDVKHYKPQTVQKMIRDNVLDHAHVIRQEPSRTLLMALMDVIDIYGTNDAEYISHHDRAGVRELMLATRNYMLYYISETQLNKDRHKDRRIIPVATYCHNAKEICFYDKERSMVGTYVVNISRNKDDAAAYFMQQVLYVPGPKSLELLQAIVGVSVDFWDMALEVPTHPHALTPAFTQATASEVLVDSNVPNAEKPQPVSPVQPMCCIYDALSIKQNNTKRETSVDCFDDKQILQDVSHFSCVSGVTKTVYFRRSGKILNGVRTNLLLVVRDVVNEEQSPEVVKYISTTARFCKAVSYSCEKGNGTLLECCHTTLQKLGSRTTFLVGDEIYQDIQMPALNAFVKRVSKDSQNRWCVHTPRYFSSLNAKPYMSETMDLGVKLFDGKVPNAFVVAELLYCPFDGVRNYATFLKRYTSERPYREHANAVVACNVEKQMNETWRLITHTAKDYLDKRYGCDVDRTKSNSRDVDHSSIMSAFANNVSSAHNVQKTWQSHVKHDSDRDAKNNKQLCRLYNTIKALFHYIRVYHARLAKLRSKEESIHTSAVSTHMVIPDQQPLAVWVKSLGLLLTSPVWLCREHNQKTRRDLVCDVLGIDLTNRRHLDVLRQWVDLNATTVEQLKHADLQDKLSKALVGHLERTSLDRWMLTVELALGFSRDTCTNNNIFWPSDEVEQSTVHPDEDLDLDRVVVGENLADTAHDDDRESGDDDDYDMTDSFIDDAYIDDQYSCDSEYESELGASSPPGRAAGKKRKLTRLYDESDDNMEASTSKRIKSGASAKDSTLSPRKRKKGGKRDRKEKRRSKDTRHNTRSGKHHQHSPTALVRPDDCLQQGVNKSRSDSPVLTDSPRPDRREQKSQLPEVRSSLHSSCDDDEFSGESTRNVCM